MKIKVPVNPSGNGKVFDPTINLSSSRKSSIIPNLLLIVVNHIPIDFIAGATGVEPPNLTERAVATSENLFPLQKVYIVENISSQSAG